MVIQSGGGSGFFVLNVKDKTQWDRYRGFSVKVEKFSDNAFGAKVAALVRTIHFGDVTGASSKVFSFVMCLLGTSFPLTGVMLWTHKLAVKRNAKKQRIIAAATATA